MACNVNLSGDAAFEGILVERVENTGQLLSILPDSFESENVDDKSKGERNPVRPLGTSPVKKGRNTDHTMP